MSSAQTRFASIVHPDLRNQKLHIFGCGAIGSFATIMLHKMGINNFTLYDFDQVESANIGVSTYDYSDLGKPKVKALESQLTGAEVNAINGKVTKETNLNLKNEIAILAFDNMEIRAEVASLICKAKAKAMIDGRMGAQIFQMYVLTKPKLADYMTTWYSDEDGDDEPCTAKATPWCGSLAGSFISNAVSKIVSGHPLTGKLWFHFPSMSMDWSKNIL